MNNPFFISDNQISEYLKTMAFGALVAAQVGFISIPPAYASSITHQDIVSLANSNRTSLGEQPLTENVLLNQAAQSKAHDMFNYDYFEHYSPQGQTPWNFILSSGYDYQLAGENLAMDFATSRGVDQAWLNSPPHAKNILNPDFTDIGVAVIDGQLNGHQTTLVVQMFGRLQPSLLDSINTQLDTPIVKTVSSLLQFD